ncbi:MAG: restriction endonuclease [Myxococcota bacterium]
MNPLPFQDLEPHRFEDLVRQLAYDFRDWHSLEAIGRAGADGGTDIRGQELVRSVGPGDDEDQQVGLPLTKTWVFQCKREKRLGPKRVEQAVSESIPKDSDSPHGFVLATSADVSRAARDLFRELMVARGVQEFFVWARGELEDRLFQPANDRLLFAYFGISLFHRRRSVGTSIRSAVAVKKLILRLIDADDNQDEVSLPVALVDASTWGHVPEPDVPDDALLRRVYRYFSQVGLIVEDAEHHGYLSPDGRSWDILEQVNLVEETVRRTIDEHPRSARSVTDPADACREFWAAHVDPEFQATYTRHQVVPFDRIVAIDPIGPYRRPIPHIYVDFAATGDPYHQDLGAESLARPKTMFPLEDSVDPDPDRRMRLFPEEIPSDPFEVPWLLQPKVVKPVRPTESTASLISEMLAPTESPDSATHLDDSDSHAVEAERVAISWLAKVAEPVLTGLAIAIEDGGGKARVSGSGSGTHALSLRFWTRRRSGFARSSPYHQHVIDIQVAARAGAVTVRWVRDFKDRHGTKLLDELDPESFEAMVLQAIKDTLPGRW